MPIRLFTSSSDAPSAPVAHLRQSLSQAWPLVAQGLLPNMCALCGNLSHTTLCACCDSAYWNESTLRCEVCAVPLTASGWRTRHSYRCADCVADEPPFDATFALADYSAPLDTLAVGLKFRAQLMLAHEFARRLARLAQDTWQNSADCPDIVAPVPLAAGRLRERGFNQAWQIARPLARALRVPANPTLLRRVIETAPQSRLDLDARRLNVGRAFQLTEPVSGLHVGIVDDVMTTGATLEALARILKAAGARRVTNFVALRTSKN
jgi:ComF family protein